MGLVRGRIIFGFNIWEVGNGRDYRRSSDGKRFWRHYQDCFLFLKLLFSVLVY